MSSREDYENEEFYDRDDFHDDTEDSISWQDQAWIDSGMRPDDFLWPK